MDQLICKTRNLVIFDFDHTVVDGNTDLYIKHTLTPPSFPQTVKDKYIKG